MSKFFIFLLLFLSCQLSSVAAGSPLELAPVAYKGRFHPMDAYAKLWLYDTYHAQKIKKNQWAAFHGYNGSASEFLWNIYAQGHQKWDKAPFFWVHYAEVKQTLALDPKTDRFSYAELQEKIYTSEKTSLALLSRVIPYFFVKNYRDPQNRSKARKIEIKQLGSGLWVSLKNDDLIISVIPLNSPWTFLKPGMVIGQNIFASMDTVQKEHKNLSEELLPLLFELNHYSKWEGVYALSTYEKAYRDLSAKKLPSQEIEAALETRFPLINRLADAGSLLKMLPGRHQSGEWYSLDAIVLKTYNSAAKNLQPIGNFTVYSDQQFEAIRQAYKAFQQLARTDPSPLASEEAHHLGHTLLDAYRSITGKEFKEAFGKSLTYPSLKQLELESLYYQLPLTEFALVFYLIASVLFILQLNLEGKLWLRWGFFFITIAFVLHTIVLALRCFILERPPVSNMFETVIYVPWIAVLVSLVFWTFFRNILLLIAAAVSALALLLLLQITNMNNHFENVQAVLDSQYWLTIHVLMIVGSYGVFILSGILGQIYLGYYLIKEQETQEMKGLAKAILHTMYLGIALLVPGTILGGVWAAESWGRFWDWDPKESWAFISCCVYLICVHAYIFHKIANFGLAVGAIVGLMTISFTWYGVNYILGTGLHSYGFGSGGEQYYYLFLVGELVFIAAAVVAQRRTRWASQGKQ